MAVVRCWRNALFSQDSSVESRLPTSVWVGGLGPTALRRSAWRIQLKRWDWREVCGGSRNRLVIVGRSSIRQTRWVTCKCWHPVFTAADAAASDERCANYIRMADWNPQRLEDPPRSSLCFQCFLVGQIYRDWKVTALKMREREKFICHIIISQHKYKCN